MKVWHDVRLLNLMANLLYTASAGALAIGLGVWAVSQPAFALRAMVIEPTVTGHPLRHVDDTLLRSLGVHRVEGTFFTVNLDEVRSAVEGVPWVRKAHVRRIWPHALHVGIEEHEPLAKWVDERLVNRHGELFSANLAEAEETGSLVSFNGPPGSEALITRRFGELQRALLPLAWRVESLVLSPRYAWTARLDNGVELILGREQGRPIVERVDQFVDLYPQVQQRLNRDADRVDLRYPDGFALRVPGALDTTGKPPSAFPRDRSSQDRASP